MADACAALAELFGSAASPRKSWLSRRLYKRFALILLTESLNVGLPFLAALLLCCSEFRCFDVPIRQAFLGDDTQVLAEIFQGGR